MPEAGMGLKSRYHVEKAMRWWLAVIYSGPWWAYPRPNRGYSSSMRVVEFLYNLYSAPKYYFVFSVSYKVAQILH
jgi:hypothetical protein